MSNRERGELPLVGPLEAESLNPSSLQFQLTFSDKRYDLKVMWLEIFVAVGSTIHN
jgi:hypothetical protein